MEHTKTPWKLYSGKLVPEYPNRIVEVQDENGKPICKWTGFDGADQSPVIRKANAEFIVRACNCHDELLAALEEILITNIRTEDTENLGGTHEIALIVSEETIKKAKAAIAKAGEK